MRKTNFLAVFLVGSIFLGACSYFRSTPVSQPATTPNENTAAERIDEEKRSRENERRWKETSAIESLTISALKKKNPKEGIYETEGYIVASVSKCDCPPGHKCKCDPASITISEKSEIPIGPKLAKDELRILTDPSKFKHDGKYLFKIRIPDSYSEDEIIDEVFLVAYRLGTK